MNLSLLFFCIIAIDFTLVGAHCMNILSVADVLVWSNAPLVAFALSHELPA